MTLGEYLRSEMQRPWEWGWADCCTFAADWVLSRTAIDPLLPWRGTYCDEAGAEDIIAQAGGLLPLVALGMDAIWQRRETPCDGMVGVITLPGETGELIDIAAIHTGKRWAMRSPRGIAFLTQPMAVRASWAR